MGMENVKAIRGEQPGGSGSGGGDEGTSMRLAKLETRIDTILPTLATKADVKADVMDAKADIIKWLSTVVIAAAAIIISVFTFMLNRAVPVDRPSPPQQAPQPIVIYAPPAQVPAAPATAAPQSR